MPNIPGQQMHLPGLAPPAAGWQQGGQRVGQFAVNLWNWGTFWSWIVLWFLVISMVLIPLMALTGQPAIIASVGLVPLAGLLAVFLHPHGPSPLWGGVIAYWPDRIFENKERWIPVLREGIPLGGKELRLNARRIAGVLFAEALLAEYYALMEYAAGGADITLIFVSFVLFITLGLGLASQPGGLRSVGVPIVIVAIVVVSIVFALGGRSGIEAIGSDDAKAVPMESAPRTTAIVLTEERQYIALLGENELAGPVDLDALPDGWRACWRAPTGTIVHYEDGFEISAHVQTHRSPVGQVWFKGPSGQSLGARATPGKCSK